MYRVCLEKATEKLIESQSGGESEDKKLEAMRLDTLRQNAMNAGYKEEDIEVKWVDEAETQAILEKQRESELTYADRRRAEYPPIGDQLDAIWKGEPFTSEMKEAVMSVKEKYPK